MCLKMPIFQKKFVPKCAPPRINRLAGSPKMNEALDDYKDISLNLNDKKLRFTEGTWLQVNQSSECNYDDLAKMKKKLKALEQENNLTLVKNEVLLDLLTENVCELNLLKSSK